MQYKFSINVFVTVFVFLLVRSCLLILMKYLKGDKNLRLCLRQLKIKFLNLVVYSWFSWKILEYPGCINMVWHRAARIWPWNHCDNHWQHHPIRRWSYKELVESSGQASPLSPRLQQTLLLYFSPPFHFLQNQCHLSPFTPLRFVFLGSIDPFLLCNMQCKILISTSNSDSCFRTSHTNLGCQTNYFLFAHLFHVKTFVWKSSLYFPFEDKNCDSRENSWVRNGGTLEIGQQLNLYLKGQSKGHQGWCEDIVVATLEEHLGLESCPALDHLPSHEGWVLAQILLPKHEIVQMRK